MHGTDRSGPSTERDFALNAPGLTVLSAAGSGAVRIALVGELDLATRPLFERAVTRLVRSGAADLVVDLGELEFLAVAGAQAFDWAGQECRRAGGRLVLVNAGRAARRLLELCTLMHLATGWTGGQHGGGPPG